jgi:hypothetical protein
MPFGKRFAAAQQYMQARGLLDATLSLQELRAQVAAIPDTAATLTCEYFVNDSYHVSLLYWRGQKPDALTDALESSLPKGHPVFAFGPPKLNCPFEMEPQPGAPLPRDHQAPPPGDMVQAFNDARSRSATRMSRFAGVQHAHSRKEHAP